MKYKQYHRKRAQDVMSEVQNDLHSVKNNESKKKLIDYPNKSRGTHNQDGTPKPIYQMGTVEIVFYPFAISLMILSLFLQGYEVFFLFGCGLLCSLLIKSLIIRLAVIFFITLSVLTLYSFGTLYFDPVALFNFLLGINEISLGPSIAGTLMAIIAMGGGIIHGLIGDSKYSGFWILGLAFIITIGDVLFAAYVQGVIEWYLIFCIHLGIYFSCFLIIWGGFYVIARLVRLGIIIALKEGE